MPVTVVTPPLEEPVSLAEAKAHLRVDGTDEDAYISALIGAAREFAENNQDRVYITQTLRISLDSWPRDGVIKLPRSPLQSVVSITYKDADGNAGTVDPTTYVVDPDSTPGRIVLARGKSWPSVTLASAGAIKVTYTAGYGGAAQVPMRIKQAILLLLSHWYETREPVVVGTIASNIPFTVEALLAQDKVY